MMKPNVNKPHDENVKNCNQDETSPLVKSLYLVKCIDFPISFHINVLILWAHYHFSFPRCLVHSWSAIDRRLFYIPTVECRNRNFINASAKSEWQGLKATRNNAAVDSWIGGLTLVFGKLWEHWIKIYQATSYPMVVMIRYPSAPRFLGEVMNYQLCWDHVWGVRSPPQAAINSTPSFAIQARVLSAQLWFLSKWFPCWEQMFNRSSVLGISWDVQVEQMVLLRNRLSEAIAMLPCLQLLLMAAAHRSDVALEQSCLLQMPRPAMSLEQMYGEAICLFGYTIDGSSWLVAMDPFLVIFLQLSTIRDDGCLWMWLLTSIPKLRRFSRKQW